MEELKAVITTAVSSTVKPVGRLDPFYRTHWVAMYEGAPLRTTKAKALEDAREWVEHYIERGSVQEEAQHELEDYSTEDLDEFITYHHELIKLIAQSKGRGLSYAEPDDIEQEIMEHVIRKWHLYSGQPASKVKSFFERAANQYLEQERDDYMHFTGSFIYTPQETRRHLRESAWLEGAECPDVDAKVDLQAAFATITKGRQDAVYRHFGLGVPTSEMTQAEKRQVHRGVDDMTAWLNRKDAARSYSLDEVRGKLFAQL